MAHLVLLIQLEKTIYENPKKINNQPLDLRVTINTKINRELYFDPSETVGLGTAAGIGIGYTLSSI